MIGFGEICLNSRNNALDVSSQSGIRPPDRNEENNDAMTEESTLTLKFPVRMPDSQKGFAYVDHEHADVSTYAHSMTAAKADLREQLQANINAALLQVANYRQHVIGCRSGDVLIVQFRHGQWGYEITGPNRTHSSAVSGFKSYDEAVEYAKRHAGSSYSGMQWDC